MHIDLSLERRLPRRIGKPRPSPWKSLIAAIGALGEDRGAILRHSESPWASVTFSGTRHAFELRFTGSEAIAAGERFIAALPDHEFTLPGQLVADAVIVAVDHRLLPEASMTVECELVLLADEG